MQQNFNYEKLFDSIQIREKEYRFVNLKEIFEQNSELKTLPFSMKILFENCIRFSKNHVDFQNIVSLFKNWLLDKEIVFETEISFYPSRVLMQDFTGVPAVVDLAAMRDAASSSSNNPLKVNPLIPVDLVIDHSVQVNHSGSPLSLKQNIDDEMRENIERYKFLKWGQKSFKNFRLVPPGMGICHQVNLEYLSSVIFKNDESKMIYPETIVGTDSHTTMINGLGVVGWGVGGIEAESAMLGEPISMNMPKVVGFKIHGKLKEGVSATDLVLTVTNILRKKGVVGKFVEFYGDGILNLSLPDRATISNMAPEYGATCGVFPFDKRTLEYLEVSGRSQEKINLAKEYFSNQIKSFSENSENQDNFHFSSQVELDLGTVKPCIAGPTRPQDLRKFEEIFSSLIEKFPIEFSKENLEKSFEVNLSSKSYNQNNSEFENGGKISNLYFANDNSEKENELGNSDVCNLKKHKIQIDSKTSLKNGDIVLASITSCTNTSNPSVLIAAGLLAKAAYEKGLKISPLIKTSLAPGSRVVSDYLKESGLQFYLDALGFNIVGYGCTTCIGNSGSLKPEIEKVISDNDLCVGAILSGNRNFEGRIQPFIKANYLASPPLVIAFALAGTLLVNFDQDPVSFCPNGKKIMLKDLWPSNDLINEYIQKFVKKEIFLKEYEKIFEGDDEWKKIQTTENQEYEWDSKSTYIKNPPYFKDFNWKRKTSFAKIENARILALLENSITTDHISPAGSIKKDSPAGKYLLENGVDFKNFNSYGSRRGNHEVMIRGTFANIRLRNLIAKNEFGEIKTGGFTKYFCTENDPSYQTIVNEEMIHSELSPEVLIKDSENIVDCKNNDIVSIYEASMKYQSEKTPLVIFAGKDYGSGSSRDWAAKGTALLGVKAVIARSFERIHRSNLVGMGVFPFIFEDSEMSFEKLEITGSEIISIDLSSIKSPLQKIPCQIKYQDGSLKEVSLISNILNESEIETLLFGGIMQKVLTKIYS